MAEEVADVPVEGEEYQEDHEPESPGPQAEPSAAAGYTAEFEAEAEEEVDNDSSAAAVASTAQPAPEQAQAQASTSGHPPSLAGAKQASATSSRGAGAPAAGHKAAPSVKPPPVAAQSSKSSSVTGQRTAASPGRGKLTFTSAPAAGRARPMARNDFSHNTYEVQKINADNMKLCNRLVEIGRAQPSPQFQNTLSVGSAAPGARLSPANIASANINRARKEDRIAQENLALYKRLQSVKPSRDVNRDTLAKEFKSAQGYGETARKFRAAPAHATPTTSH